MNYTPGQLIYYTQKYDDGTLVKLLSEVIEEEHLGSIGITDIYIDPIAEDWDLDSLEVRVTEILSPVIYNNITEAKQALPELFI